MNESTNSMLIIPAIDLRGGKCVRLRQGDFQQETVFADDPAAVAEHWQAQGAEFLHLVDLDGAREGRLVNLPGIEAILDRVSIPCQLGGGLRDDETIARLLDQGITRVVIGTRALDDSRWFEQLCRRFPDRVVLGVDARGGHVAVQGWEQTSAVTVAELLRRWGELPLAAVIYTDIERDGMLAGVNHEAVADVVRQSRWPVIASGGVTTVEDVRRLSATGVAGCIIGRALYEGTITLADAQQAAQQP